MVAKLTKQLLFLSENYKNELNFFLCYSQMYWYTVGVFRKISIVLSSSVVEICTNKYALVCQFGHTLVDMSECNNLAC